MSEPIIRGALNLTTSANGREAHAELDALVAENQQLRDALEAVASAFTAWSEDWNDGTYAYYKSDDLMVACVAARAALAGTPSEDT
jgi:deoxyribodipyrimidine photolyase